MSYINFGILTILILASAVLGSFYVRAQNKVMSEEKSGVSSSLIELNNLRYEFSVLQDENIRLKNEMCTINKSNSELQISLSEYRNLSKILNKTMRDVVRSTNDAISNVYPKHNTDIKYSMAMVGDKIVTITFNRSVFLIGKDASDENRMLCYTDSMMPLFNCQDTLIAYDVEPSEVHKGDVVKYAAFASSSYINNDYGYRWIVHKVVDEDYGNDYITTAGINNAQWDYPILKSDVEAKVWR